MSHTIAETKHQGRDVALVLGDLTPMTREEQCFINMLTVVCPKDEAGRAAMMAVMQAIVAAAVSTTPTPS